MELAARTGVWARSGSPLPYDAEVEYIKTTGTQRIDFGITISSSMNKIVLRFENDGLSGGSWYGVVFVGYSSDVPCVARESGFITTGNFRGSWMRWYVYANNEVTFDFDSKSVVVKDFVSGNVITNLDGVTNVRYGKQIRIGGNEITKFFGLYTEENHTPVLDCIPVRFTNENGASEGAMYDRVSGQLFRNAGTGAFLIGPDKT